MGELLLNSPDFARLWERYEVKGHRQGRKTFHHSQLGTLTLVYQSMQLEGTPGQRMTACYAQPATPDYDAMILLDLAANEPAPAPPTSQPR